MYYDVVCSVYETSKNGLDYRVDSHLLCGGFKTINDAIEYIDTHDCADEHYDVGRGRYTCIEIEAHGKDGVLTTVITVD